MKITEPQLRKLIRETRQPNVYPDDHKMHPESGKPLHWANSDDTTSRLTTDFLESKYASGGAHQWEDSFYGQGSQYHLGEVTPKEAREYIQGPINEPGWFVVQYTGGLDDYPQLWGPYDEKWRAWETFPPRNVMTQSAVSESQLRVMIREQVQQLSLDLPVPEQDREMPVEGKTHKDCGGTFTEMSINDDWDGTRTCNRCGTKIPAHLSPRSPQSRMIQEQTDNPYAYNKLRKAEQGLHAWDRAAAGNRGPDTGKQMANYTDFSEGWAINEDGFDLDACENGAQRRGWEAFEEYGPDSSVDEAFEDLGLEYGF
jgi:hypothetical protein